MNAKIDQCFIFFFIWKLYTFAPRKLNATSLKVRLKLKNFLVSEYITGISSFVIVALDVKISKKMVGYLNDAKRPRKKKRRIRFGIYYW